MSPAPSASGGSTPGAANGAPAPDPLAVLRSPEYVRLLLLAALAGVPISALSYGFLALVNALQTAVFTDIPHDVLGFASTPAWWPLPTLALGGVLTALAIRRLPGTGGHSPVDGFAVEGVTPPVDIPGVFLAALATLSFGVVLGPEAPLILLGSGLGALAARLLAPRAPPRAVAVIAAAGSFAAISSLLGSPLLGAFLLLEAAGLAGPAVGVVLVPGLLAAGLGSLVFVGLDSLTGLGTLSLALPDLPHFGRPTVSMFGYAIAFGLIAPVLGSCLRELALALRARIEPRMVLLMPVAGLGIGGLAILFAQVTGHGTAEVLFSGQTQLGPLIAHAAGWSVGALLLLVACKSLAYALALSSFRGGPIFPALFIGAAAGLAASHLPGLSLVPAVAMGMGAMACSMLGLPMTSTLLAALLLAGDEAAVVPLVIVSVVVAYVTRARLAGRLAARTASPARGEAGAAGASQTA